MNKNKDISDPFSGSLKGANHAEKHKKLLGLDTPRDYFAKSKIDILNTVQKKETISHTLFNLKQFYFYPIAASVLLLIGLGFWLKYNQNKETFPTYRNIELVNLQVPEDEFLLQSLLVDESVINQYVDDYILENVIAETQQSEIEIEKVLINSLFINDSLIDGYIDNSLSEIIVL